MDLQCAYVSSYIFVCIQSICMSTSYICMCVDKGAKSARSNVLIACTDKNIFENCKYIELYTYRSSVCVLYIRNIVYCATLHHTAP